MSAVISDCGLYRYRLDRQVGGDLDGLINDEPKVFAYFGVNPSTADATVDDQTVAKWIGFTRRNGGSRFIVGNLFAYRATDVSVLSTVSDPVGPKNMQHLEEIVAEADVLVPCFGRRSKMPKSLLGQIDVLVGILHNSGKPVLCFGLNADGSPRHPQMLGYDTELVPWTSM